MVWKGILCLSAVVLAYSYYNCDCSNWHHAFQHMNKIPVLGPFLYEKAGLLFHPAKDGGATSTGAETTADGEKLFTVDELKEFTGERGLHLAILGRVYDVKKGERFYAKGKTYHGFTGRDGSRAFITGDFTEEGLTDDVMDLQPRQLLELEKWTKTYAKDYIYKGKLIGRYYDENGKPTAYRKRLIKAFESAHELEKQEEDVKKLFPPCDSHYVKDQGGKVLCTLNSGGIKRDWVGVPRKLFNPESNSVRCACVHESRLNDPNLSEYPDCNKMAPECVTSTS